MKIPVVLELFLYAEVRTDGRTDDRHTHTDTHTHTHSEANCRNSASFLYKRGKKSGSELKKPISKQD